MESFWKEKRYSVFFFFCWAMTEHNNALCERTCLRAPLCPRGRNMIFKGVKAFWGFHFQAEQGLGEGSSVTAWRPSGTLDAENPTCFNSFCPCVYLALLVNVSLSASHTFSVLPVFSHSPYLQRNTWIQAVTVGVDGLTVNLLGNTVFKYLNPNGKSSMCMSHV